MDVVAIPGIIPLTTCCMSIAILTLPISLDLVIHGVIMDIASEITLDDLILPMHFVPQRTLPIWPLKSIIMKHIQDVLHGRLLMKMTGEDEMSYKK